MAEERPPRVLVIDDDSSIREVVCSLLASFGYDCQTAADGAQGLARFDEGGWDLVLTDLARAVAIASAHEERVRFVFHEDCRRAATRNSIGSSTLDRN
jgi:CheY-like chemotaxis protein